MGGWIDRKDNCHAAAPQLARTRGTNRIGRSFRVNFQICGQEKPRCMDARVPGWTDKNNNLQIWQPKRGFRAGILA
jgi:hypothetical protein